MMQVEYVAVGKIKPYSKNAKKHPPGQVEHIANSIREFGFKQPLVIDKDGVLVIGHGRLLAAKLLGMSEVPCVRADDLTEEQIKALRLADNKTNESEWDIGLLAEDLDSILDIDMEQFGFDVALDVALDETEVPEEHPSKSQGSSLREKYLVPPFSVIYGNRPDWLSRKRAWVARGIRSELGRGEKLVYQFPDYMNRQSTGGK